MPPNAVLFAYRSAEIAGGAVENLAEKSRNQSSQKQILVESVHHVLVALSGTFKGAFLG